LEASAQASQPAAALACADAEALAYLETQRHYSARTAETMRETALLLQSDPIKDARAELKIITDELNERRRAVAAAARTLAELRTRYEALAKRHGEATAEVAQQERIRDTAEWHAIYSAALTEALAAECERRRRAAAAGVAPARRAKAPRQRGKSAARKLT